MNPVLKHQVLYMKDLAFTYINPLKIGTTEFVHRHESVHQVIGLQVHLLRGLSIHKSEGKGHPVCIAFQDDNITATRRPCLFYTLGSRVHSVQDAWVGHRSGRVVPYALRGILRKKQLTFVHALCRITANTVPSYRLTHFAFA